MGLRLSPWVPHTQPLPQPEGLGHWQEPQAPTEVGVPGPAPGGSRALRSPLRGRNEPHTSGHTVGVGTWWSSLLSGGEVWNPSLEGGMSEKRALWLESRSHPAPFPSKGPKHLVTRGTGNPVNLKTEV